MLVTGFGAFGGVEDNPSAHLARDLDPDATILRVSWEEVAAWAWEQRPATILALGVAVKRTEPTYELFGHNAADPRADVDGALWPRPAIVPDAPQSLGATLLTPAQLAETSMKLSFTPGGYLCNFLLYRLLWELRGTGARVGFVHVASFEVCPRELQLQALRDLLLLAGSDGAEGPTNVSSSSAMNSSIESSSPTGHSSNGPDSVRSREPMRHSPEITAPSHLPR